jgi:hypothetical protein
MLEKVRDWGRVAMLRYPLPTAGGADQAGDRRREFTNKSNS